MQNENLQTLKILQKAREFGDFDLSNESLVKALIQAQIPDIKAEDKKQIADFLNELVQSKQKALLSK